MSIDFGALASRLLAQSRSLLAEWYPQGKLVGHEFCIGDVYGAEGESCKVNVNTGKWADFAAGLQGGDLISLYAAREGLNQAEAARKLNGDETIASRIVTPAPQKPPEPEAWIAIMPVPPDAPEPTNDYYRKGANGDWIKLQFVTRWAYKDLHGRLLGYAVRFEWREGDDLKKDIVPQTYCAGADGKRQWRWKSFPEPRPLYGLDQLLKRPGDPVMLVEGEKKVEALKVLAPQYIGITWPGGAKAWRKADWRPLHGRAVTCWPDADKQVVTSERAAKQYGVAMGARIPADQQPGLKAMWDIGHHLLKQCPSVKVIIPDDETLPDAWDAADAVRDGWDWPRFKAWAITRVFTLGGGNGTAGAEQRGAGRRDVRAADRAHDASGDGHQAAAPVAPGMVAVEARDAAPGDPQVARGAQQHPDHDGTPSADRGAAGGSRRGGGKSEPHQPRDHHDDRQPSGRGEPTGAASRPSSALHKPDDVHAGADAARAAPSSPVAKWLAWGLERNGNGLPITNLNNAVAVIESDPQLRGLVWFDEFLNRVMTGSPAREWTDADDIDLTLYMQRMIGISKLGRETVSQAVTSYARRNKRNCVREFIEATPHDGQARIDGFLARAFHCEDTPYTRAASRNFWIGMVARVYQPGCKVDNMIVLEGKQGLLKSSALAAIAEPWFAEQHESATNAKAFAEVLQGKLIVEVSEMDAFSRAEVNTIKKVISCQWDRFRPSYARHATDHPRQGIMAGSTNKDDWNRDETGARRMWPIRCVGEADIEYIRRERAQCFAEALVALRAGSTWWEMPAEETRAEQERRYTEDAWLEPVAHWLQGRGEVSTNEIAVACLHMSLRDVDRGVQLRLSSVLGRLGWRKHHTRNGKRWSPPADEYGSQAKVQLVGTNTSTVTSTEQNSDYGSQVGHDEKDLPFQ